MIIVELDGLHFVAENIIAVKHYQQCRTHIWVRGDEEPWCVNLSESAVLKRLKAAGNL